LYRQHIEQVGQWQPDRANLLPSRRQAVENATRHHEMRARVPVREREPGAVKVNRRPEPEQHHDGGDQERDPRRRARGSEGDGLSQGF
jgi:hypothetical protein